MFVRNTGLHSGRSIEHPHSQIVGSVIVPPGIVEVLEEYRKYQEAMRGACLYCHHLEEVERAKSNEGSSLLVSENEYCVAFAPYAPEFLFEVWIVPRQCNCSFAYPLRDGEKFRSGVSRMLIDVARRLSMFLEGRPEGLNYNIVLCTVPYEDDHRSGAFHWHIRILPRGYQIDGSIEIVAKLPIRPQVPEEWARAMRLIGLNHNDII